MCCVYDPYARLWCSVVWSLLIHDTVWCDVYCAVGICDYDYGTMPSPTEENPKDQKGTLGGLVERNTSKSFSAWGPHTFGAWGGPDEESAAQGEAILQISKVEEFALTNR